MNRQAQGVVMLLLGGAAFKAGVTDLHLRYVKESLQPFLIAAAVVLVAAGAMTLWYEWRRPAADPGHREPRVGWLLVAPVLGLLVVAPPALGSYAATTTGAALTSQQTSALPPLPEHVDPVPLPVVDYVARATWDEGSLADRRVELTGFVVTGEEGETYLVKLALSCCAADARPVKVGLDLRRPPGLVDDAWIEVVGTYQDHTSVDPINEATIPYLQVQSWRRVEEPRQPYE